MADGRARPRMAPPQLRGERAATVVLAPADYRALYELTLTEGTSMAETLRRIIRQAAEKTGPTQ